MVNYLFDLIFSEICKFILIRFWDRIEYRMITNTEEKDLLMPRTVSSLGSLVNYLSWHPLINCRVINLIIAIKVMRILFIVEISPFFLKILA